MGSDRPYQLAPELQRVLDDLKRLEPELIHASLNLFNSALYPDANRRVEPVLEALAIRAALLPESPLPR